MDAVRVNPLRVGHFTSSNFHKLMSEGKAAGSYGKPFNTYIEEKRYERKLGRSLNKEANTYEMTWGKACEIYVLEQLLNTSYQPCSTESLVHPKFPEWTGTPDAFKHLKDGKKIVELKCPFTLLSFCKFAESATIDEAIKKHDDAVKYAWQCRSNCAITGLNDAELIIFCPYEDELDKIKAIATSLVNEGKYEYKWLMFADNETLPYIHRGGEYRHLHYIDVPLTADDNEKMEARAMEAIRLLNT